VAATNSATNATTNPAESAAAPQGRSREGEGARGGGGRDAIAALGRRGVAGRVVVGARVCFKWNEGEWYLGTTLKRGVSRCVLYFFACVNVCVRARLRAFRV